MVIIEDTKQPRFPNYKYTENRKKIYLNVHVCVCVCVQNKRNSKEDFMNSLHN